MVVGGERLHCPRPPPDCVRLPYPYIKLQEGGGKKGLLLLFLLLLTPPPSAQTKRGRATYRSRSTSETPPLLGFRVQTGGPFVRETELL